ncbi:MAG: hypothetical protein JWR90_1793 [Marmoricola sp.]|nr:hypothetical protein [Marmoricola sp.]
MAGVLALLALLLTGCKVDVPDTDVPTSQRQACRSLVTALPDHVSDQDRRGTTGNPLGAAWGDPAIVLRCGVGTPAGYDPLVGCQTVNGMDWFIPEAGMNDQQVDVVMTTYGRVPAVEVRLPAEYRPPVAAMVDLAATIAKHTKVVKSCS